MNWLWPNSGSSPKQQATSTEQLTGFRRPYAESVARGERSTQAIEVVLALFALVAGLGILLIALSLLLTTVTAVPGIGLVLLIVGLALAFEFGVRPLKRRGQSPISGLGSGLARIGRWTSRMVRGGN